MKILTYSQRRTLARLVGPPTKRANFAVIKAIIEKGEELEDNVYRVSTSTISNETLCEIATIYLCLRRMHNAGFIDIIEDGRGGRSTLDGKGNNGGVYRVLLDLGE